MNNVHTFQEADGRWRWEYRDDKVDLKSNRTYADERSALLAAQTAYPEHLGANAPGGDAARGFIGKIAKFLTLVLLITVWRRRRSQPS
jgi:hypothetical protein